MPLAALTMTGNAGGVAAVPPAAAEKSTTTRVARTMRERRSTNPPSARGSMVAAGSRSSDSGLPPPPPSRAAAQWRRGGAASPLTAAGPSRTRTGVPSLRAVLCDDSSIVSVRPLALDLDGVLADTRPLWNDWLADASRRARVDLDVPDDRAAAADVLDERLGDWRPLLRRFADDRAPVHFRPRAETGAALRRLRADGVRLGVFTDAPRELADVALAHVGAARRVEAVGTLEEVLKALGDGAVVVRSREELAAVVSEHGT